MADDLDLERLRRERKERKAKGIIRPIDPINGGAQVHGFNIRPEDELREAGVWLYNARTKRHYIRPSGSSGMRDLAEIRRLDIKQNGEITTIVLEEN